MKVHLVAVAAVVLALSGCARKTQNAEAVRQGVLDYLSAKGMNPQTMQVDVTRVNFRENEADAAVNFRAKGAEASSGFTMNYTLERKGDRWVVKGRKDGGANPHGGMGGGVMPGMGGQGMGGQVPPGHPEANTGGAAAPSGETAPKK